MFTSSKDGRLGFWNINDNYSQLAMIPIKEETELNVLHFMLLNDQPYLLIGGASGALTLFDINKSKQVYRQSVFTQSELTKIFSLHKQGVIVLNAD